MRYIRTKDGRIIDKERVIKGLELVHLEDTPTDYCPSNGWYWKDQDGYYELEVGDDENEREANTIQELCDKFVIVYQLKDRVGHTDIGTFPYAKEFLNVAEAERLKRELFGGVWTRKGFTYVARLNDKDELDLDVSSAKLY